VGCAKRIEFQFYSCGFIETIAPCHAETARFTAEAATRRPEEAFADSLHCA
jgi:hypothetical protein